MTYATGNGRAMTPARLIFVHYLRTGRRLQFEQKYNHNHDPASGQFTFAAGGAGSSGPPDRPTIASKPKSTAITAASRKPVRNESKIPSELANNKRYYQGVTANGIGEIAPVSGGNVDKRGKYVPEQFAPDSFRLTDPVSALAHYVGGTGTPRNFYFNSIDTSGVELVQFPSIKQLLASSKPGRYRFVDAAHQNFAAPRFSPANVIGRISLRATGTLQIDPGGKYSFDGYLGSGTDTYDFNPSKNRSAMAEVLTTIGRQFAGKTFSVHIIGTRPYSASGIVPKLKD